MLHDTFITLTTIVHFTFLTSLEVTLWTSVVLQDTLGCSCSCLWPYMSPDNPKPTAPLSLPVTKALRIWQIHSSWQEGVNMKGLTGKKKAQKIGLTLRHKWMGLPTTNHFEPSPPDRILTVNSLTQQVKGAWVMTSSHNYKWIMAPTSHPLSDLMA